MGLHRTYLWIDNGSTGGCADSRDEVSVCVLTCTCKRTYTAVTDTGYQYPVSSPSHAPNPPSLSLLPPSGSTHLPGEPTFIIYAQRPLGHPGLTSFTSFGRCPVALGTHISSYIHNGYLDCWSPFISIPRVPWYDLILWMISLWKRKGGNGVGSPFFFGWFSTPFFTVSRRLFVDSWVRTWDSFIPDWSKRKIKGRPRLLVGVFIDEELYVDTAGKRVVPIWEWINQTVCKIFIKWTVDAKKFCSLSF